MSMLTMNTTEEKQIDSQIEQMLDWAKTRQAEAEQLALDSARLMACTGDRMDKLKNQGFFKRCWNRLSGKTGEMERANINDLISMQKKAFRYLNMLQEQQLLMAHSLLALKNNLVSLAIREEETRNLVGLLAQKTQDRFEKLEGRVDQLEISTNLQGWLLGLEEREYDEKFPTEYMRLFRVINDFYNIKKDNWNYNDLMFMRKAIRTVGINPKRKLSLNAFIDTLTDEIQTAEVGFEAYGNAITMFKPEGIENYSKFAIENISSPVFVSMHGLKTQYVDRLDIVETLEDEMNISKSEALKILLRRSIANLNVNLDYEFPLAETAIEILGCLRLAELLTPEIDVASKDEEHIPIELADNIQDIQEAPNQETYLKIDVNNIAIPNFRYVDLPREDGYRIRRFEFETCGHITGNCLPTPIECFDDKIFVATNEKIFMYDDITKSSKIIDSNQTTNSWDFLSFSSSSEWRTFHIANDNLYFLDGSKVHVFDKTATKFLSLSLPQKYNGCEIIYTNVFYINNNLCFVGKYRDRVSTLVFYFGKDINSLEDYSLINKMPRHDIASISFVDGYLIAAATPGSARKTIALISNDCKNWRKSSAMPDDNYFGHIINFGNKCFIVDGNYNRMYPLQLDTGEIESNSIYSEYHNDLIKHYPQYGLDFAIASESGNTWNDNKNTLYVATSPGKWKKIATLPDKPSCRSLAFDGKTVYILTDFRIYYGDLI